MAYHHEVLADEPMFYYRLNEQVHTGSPGLSYRDEVLADAPLGYWRHSEATGATALVDSSGATGRDTTVSGTLTSVAGLLVGDANTALSYGGTGNRAAVAWGSWQEQGSFTVETLLNLSSITGVQQAVTRRYQTLGGAFTIRINAGAPQILTFSGTDTVDSVSSPTALAVNTTYHLAVSRDNATGITRIYVNGAEVASGTTAMRITSGVALNFGGQEGAAQEPLIGVLDEVAYYGTALSAARIQAHYEASIGAQPAQLTQAADETVNARHGVYGSAAVLGGPGLLIGDTNDAVQLDGTADSYVHRDDGLPVATDMTFEILFSTTQPNSLDEKYLIYQGDGVAWPPFSLSIDDGYLVFYTTVWAYGFPGSDPTVTSPTRVNDGLTHHVVARIDQFANRSLHLDGVQIEAMGSLSDPSVVYGSLDQPFWFGREFSGAAANRFIGVIDEIAYYAKILSSDRIAVHYDVVDPTVSVGMVFDDFTLSYLPAPPPNPALYLPEAVITEEPT